MVKATETDMIKKQNINVDDYIIIILFNNVN